MKLRITILSFCLIVIASGTIFGQHTWHKIAQPAEPLLIPTTKQFFFSLADEPGGKTVNDRAINTLDLPDPDGHNQTFTLKAAKTMSAKLAAKFPTIKSYVGINEHGETASITITAKGVRAMVFGRKGLYFIDPAIQHNNKILQSYYKRDLKADPHSTFEELEPIIYDKAKFTGIKNKVNSGRFLPPSGNQLRRYRIAITATGEYTQFHGGNVVDAMAAIVTTMARVNGIYERELSITMELIDNNEQLIFTNASTDPFTNGDAGVFIDEVQEEIDDIIGNANYDIGHGFSTGAGGLAGLGVVCQAGRKGSGVTGTNSPIGDPFDVDFVAHEIGHQFGAPHTFNGTAGSCTGGNRNASTAYEPGSGITIMAYAGICASDNLANNSIPFFHTSSLDFITLYSQQSTGNNCAEITETGNSIPIVEAGPGGFSIPVSTPFQLNGSATDPDGDNLTYSWEQFDLGPAGSPENPEDNAPLFRNFVPTTDSFRIFPRLTDILNQTQTFGEILPDYARDLSFMLTVRDDQAVGGVDKDLINFSVSDVGGPFTVDELTGPFSGLENIAVNWDVANTNLSPINCNFVNIYASDDGGQHFDYLLIENTPNDGNQVVELPNINAANLKIKVAAAENIFFNIAPGVISLSESNSPTFTVSTNFLQAVYCPDDLIGINIASQSILGFTEDINLSISDLDADLAGNLINNVIAPGESTTLEIMNSSNLSGNYIFNLNAVSGSISKTVEINLLIINEPEAPSITAPSALTTTSIQPLLTWEDDNLLATYDIDIATDPDFDNILLSFDDINQQSLQITQPLESSTTYFGRISAKNSCGLSEFNMFNFNTAAILCETISAEDLPLFITGETPTQVIATLDVQSTGEIENIEVINLTGSHSFISDLSFTLESPQGTLVKLLSNVCSDEKDFNIQFSDLLGADLTNIPCPPDDGNFYQSEDALGVLRGESITGEWKLRVDDAIAQDGGSLNSWGLKICAKNAIFELNSPSQLAAAYIGNLVIELSWTDNSDFEEQFIIERKPVNDTNFEVIDSVESNITTYTDKLPLALETFNYRIAAKNDNFNSDYSNTIVASVAILANEALPKTNISFYPNPTDRILYIQNDNNLIIKDVKLFNLSGQRMGDLNIHQRSIDLSNFSAGIYILSLDISGDSYRTKILIR